MAAIIYLIVGSLLIIVISGKLLLKEKDENMEPILAGFFGGGISILSLVLLGLLFAYLQGS